LENALDNTINLVANVIWFQHRMPKVICHQFQDGGIQ